MSNQYETPPTNQPANQQAQLFAYLDQPGPRRAIERLLKAAPGIGTPQEKADRFIAVLWTCVRDTPDLLKCKFESIVGAALEAARIGMEPGASEGLCYLIPRKIRGEMVANLEMGYHGLVKMMYQNEMVAGVDADVVHANDHFKYRKGLNPILEHIPDWKERGPQIGAWALVKLTTGESIFEYATEAEIQEIRKGVFGTDSKFSPWSKYPAAMSKKTILKRVAKYAPKSTTARAVIALDDKGEAGVHDPSKILEMPVAVAEALTGPVDKPQALDNEPAYEPLKGHLGASVTDAAEALHGASCPDATDNDGFPSEADFHKQNDNGQPFGD